jgi:hypothetical protein
VERLAGGHAIPFAGWMSVLGVDVFCGIRSRFSDSVGLVTA